MSDTAEHRGNPSEDESSITDSGQDDDTLLGRAFATLRWARYMRNELLELTEDDSMGSLGHITTPTTHPDRQPIDSPNIAASRPSSSESLSDWLFARSIHLTIPHASVLHGITGIMATLRTPMTINEFEKTRTGPTAVPIFASEMTHLGELLEDLKFSGAVLMNSTTAFAKETHKSLPKSRIPSRKMVFRHGLQKWLLSLCTLEECLGAIAPRLRGYCRASLEACLKRNEGDEAAEAEASCSRVFGQLEQILTRLITEAATVLATIGKARTMSITAVDLEAKLNGLRSRVEDKWLLPAYSAALENADHPLGNLSLTLEDIESLAEMDHSTEILSSFKKAVGGIASWPATDPRTATNPSKLLAKETLVRGRILELLGDLQFVVFEDQLTDIEGELGIWQTQLQREENALHGQRNGSVTSDSESRAAKRKAKKGRQRVKKQATVSPSVSATTTAVASPYDTETIDETEGSPTCWSESLPTTVEISSKDALRSCDEGEQPLKTPTPGACLPLNEPRRRIRSDSTSSAPARVRHVGLWGAFHQLENTAPSPRSLSMER